MPCIVKKSIRATAAASVHLIAQVKANQPALHHAIAALCDTAAPVDSTQTPTRASGRRNGTRTVEVFVAKGGQFGRHRVDGPIRLISASIATSPPLRPTTGLWRIAARPPYLSSGVSLPARQCAQAIRDHWHIENRSHYVRDGSFAEDASRIRCNPGIFARLRLVAANILRFNGNS